MGIEHESLRSAARQQFKDAGLTYDVLSPKTMQRLRTLVNERMKASGLIFGHFRCRQRGIIKKTPHGLYAELRCRADYFDDREAVSFNTDGFIGFAGWADDKNIVPILEGFSDWVAEIRALNKTEGA